MDKSQEFKPDDGIDYDIRKSIIDTLFGSAYEYAQKVVRNELNKEKVKHQKVFSILIENLTMYDAHTKMESIPVKTDLSKCSLAFKKIVEIYCSGQDPYATKMDDVMNYIMKRVMNLRVKYTSLIGKNLAFKNILDSCYKELQDMNNQMYIRINEKGATIDDSVIWLIRVSLVTVKEYRQSKKGYQPPPGKINDLNVDLKNLEAGITRNNRNTNSNKLK